MNLTTKQQLRIDVISKYLCGKIHREDAELALEVKERQFRRLVKKFKEKGVSSVVHGNFGLVPNNKTPPEIEHQIIELYKKKYLGLNVSHFREKLYEEQLYYIPSYATIRRILSESKLMKKYSKSGKRVHKSRLRYEKEGIMVQIDGSHHAWFPSRICCLTAAIDDATGKILSAKFSAAETTFDTMNVIEEVITKYGCFQILYSDKAGIYGGGKREGFTNVNRAMEKLGIISLQANSPQAKGRIERLFRTLQDRLISELRIRNINTIEGANLFLREQFIPSFNSKFSVVPTIIEPAYKALPDNVDLKEIFCMTEFRTVHSGQIIFFQSNKYLITTDLGISLENREIEIRIYRDNSIKFFYLGREIQFKRLETAKRAA